MMYCVLGGCFNVTAFVAVVALATDHEIVKALVMQLTIDKECLSPLVIVAVSISVERRRKLFSQIIKKI